MCVCVCVCVCVCAALSPCPDEGEVDATGPTDHPVLPGGVRSVRGIHACLGPQASLERRAGGAPAGGAHRCSHCEWDPVFF